MQQNHATFMLGKLLQPGDPAPVVVGRQGGASPFLILCDHAGRAVPRALADLGVGPADWERHIAWDIGAGAVAGLLAARLGAVMIAQAYSRLVIDCNRRPGHPTSIPPVSDGIVIPANEGLDPAKAALRAAEIFAPYHEAIARELDARRASGQPSVVIAVHSFTPVFGGVVRRWEAGVLHDRNPGFAIRVGEALRARGFEVGDNEPYQLSDDSDYTVPVHAEARGLDYVELEIRQDLIAGRGGQEEWAAMLQSVLQGLAGR
jgi:predicted N-formylglutamate amidohydrolase